jgi:hypothetical protein
MLGRAHSFGLLTRVTRVGPITLGDIIHETDVRMYFDESRPSYHVCVPLRGWIQARHRGQELTSTPALGSIYRPDAGITVTRWPGGSRHLQVKIDQLAVDRALETLLLGAPDSPVAFGAALPLQAGAAQDWVRLLLMVHRQLECPEAQASSNRSGVTADSVSGMPSTFALRSAIDSKRRIRPATASFVIGGSASRPNSSNEACRCSMRNLPAAASPLGRTLTLAQGKRGKSTPQAIDQLCERMPFLLFDAHRAAKATAMVDGAAGFGHDDRFLVSVNLLFNT